MTMTARKPSTFTLGVTCLDTDEPDAPNAQVFTPGQITSFICPRCSNTHLELTLPGMKFAMVMSPMMAEKLGHELISPLPDNSHG